VRPACDMPKFVGKNPNNTLVINNLQKTPMDKFAKIVVHGKSDEFLELVMKYLDIEIPKFTLRRRVLMEFISETKKLKVLGIDIDEMPATYFYAVQIGDTYLEEEPYIFDVEGDEFNSDVGLFPMGHYKEQPFNIPVTFNTNSDIQLLYQCIYDLEFGWNIEPVMIDEKIQLVEVDYEAYHKTVELLEDNTSKIRTTGKKQEDTSQWHSIIPLENCEHVSEFVKNTDGISEAFRNNSCKGCNDKSENWYCLTCGDVFCSRYVSGHGVDHYEKTGHAILMSFSDLSTWCYLCDYYIADVAIRPALYLLHLSKFKVPHPSDDSLENICIYYCNSCQNSIKKEVYHCLECDDYDLCKDCFTGGKYSGTHTKEHETEKRKIIRRKEKTRLKI